MKWIRRWQTVDTTVPCVAASACLCSTRSAPRAFEPCRPAMAGDYSMHGRNAFFAPARTTMRSRLRLVGGTTSSPFEEGELPAYEWAKVPVNIGRNPALDGVPATSRWLFVALLSEVWGCQPAGQFTYSQAFTLKASQRGLPELLKPLLDKGLIGVVGPAAQPLSNQVDGDCAARAATAQSPRSHSAVTAQSRSTFVILNYAYWSCGGPGVSPAQGTKDHHRKNDGGRSPSRARPREEKRREETLTDRTPSGSVRSVSAPDAAPRDARSAAQRPAGGVVASGDLAATVAEVIVEKGIANTESGDAGKTWTEKGEQAIADIRKALEQSKANPLSTGRDQYLGNREWKDLAERRDRLRQAAELGLGYVHTGKKPPPPELSGDE